MSEQLKWLEQAARGERQRIAADALLRAAQGRLANPHDVVVLVDLDSVAVSPDGAVDPGQVRGAVEAVRGRYSAAVWRPLDLTQPPPAPVRAPAPAAPPGTSQADRLAAIDDHVRARTGAGLPRSQSTEPAAPALAEGREARLRAIDGAVRARTGVGLPDPPA